MLLNFIKSNHTVKRTIPTTGYIPAFSILFLYFLCPQAAPAKASAERYKQHTLKKLALSFLGMVGIVLTLEGWSGEKAEEQRKGIRCSIQITNCS